MDDTCTSLQAENKCYFSCRLLLLLLFFYFGMYPSVLWYWPCGIVEQGYKLTTCNQPLKREFCSPRWVASPGAALVWQTVGNPAACFLVAPWKPSPWTSQRFHNNLKDIRRWRNLQQNAQTQSEASFFFLLLLAFWLRHQSQSLELSWLLVTAKAPFKSDKRRSLWARTLEE